MLATQVFIIVQYILNAGSCLVTVPVQLNSTQRSTTFTRDTAFASLRVHALTGRSRLVSILTFVLACGPVVMTLVSLIIDCVQCMANQDNPPTPRLKPIFSTFISGTSTRSGNFFKFG